jgi:outer membrane protein assembly factor BamB
MYRNSPERSGSDLAQTVSTHLRELWNFRPLNIGVHSASKSSPAVDESGIYVGTDGGYFYALDFDGRLRWKLYLADSPRGIHGTAALSADTVFIGGYNGVLYALDKSTGQVRWAKKLGDAIGASPALSNGVLFVSVETNDPDGFVAKLTADTGEVLWLSSWLGEQSHSSPTLAANKNLVMVGSNDGNFWGFDITTGEKRFSRRLLDAMKSTAAAFGDDVFFTSWDQRLVALHMTNGHQRWAVSLSAAKIRGGSISGKWPRHKRKIGNDFLVVL